MRSDEAAKIIEKEKRCVLTDCERPECKNCGLVMDTGEILEALDMAISALEKQTPKKPKHIDKNATFDGNWKRVCPACGRVLVERITTPEESYPRIYNCTPHCICGQAIDWEEE